jgi:hypothetical protein
MKKLILFFLCLSIAAATHAQRSVKQYIIHIYPIAGSTAQPLDEVTIKQGDSQVQKEDNKVTIFTDNTSLRIIADFARENVKSHIPSANPDPECYGVILFAQTALVTRYYLNSHAQSKAYFKHFIAVLTSKHVDKNVIDELQKIYVRVNW